MRGPDREAWLLGQRSLERGDTRRALDCLVRLRDTRPRYADVHYLLGLVYDELGDTEGAVRSLEQALRINPAYAEAFLALASVYERRGEFARSEALAERLTPLALDASGVPPVEGGSPDPTTRAKLANLHALLGDAYREAGEPREAIEAYRKALGRCPGFHDIRLRLGVCLREAGLPAQALAELRRVLRANPRYLDAAVQIGLTLYTLGRAGEARSEWERVLAEDPARQDAAMYLRMLRAPGGAEPD
jgi:tetratricopeptide (TPR) repeat protein